MATTQLRKAQFAMADFLRDPQAKPAPQGVEPRRLKIYQDLVYNNIEGFISGGFPILRSLYADAQWHALVHQFIDGHRCHTPYFLEISQEFLDFLTSEYQALESDPPFIAELAHYEWVELALDISEESLDEFGELADPLREIPTLSPLAWLLSYQFPVHKVGPAFQPDTVDEPTFLVVYRNREDKVCFMELNPATARLLELLRGNTDDSGAMLLSHLAQELGMPEETVAGFGGELLGQLNCQSIICAPVAQ
ncbi:MAG: putative DNA-binding domain-containing protein [Proteobacteria bacterium]|nr:putative DNA-binding domain-containing protein [Pseudomonadota bacterium]